MSRKLRFEYPGALYHIINREGSQCVSSENATTLAAMGGSLKRFRWGANRESVNWRNV